ncbi:MAG: hypothetical protein CUN56_05390 [Phototrophicales bacterium]|nr:MAG: hypothetical protein CUN56_05390 [Phototrophicales bacterium]RMG75054.1 MAG: hypothetical protein D6711_07515 [Chloroflexota bacterium]
MSETTYHLERDLKEAEAMAKALTPYVHEDQLYGAVGRSGFFSAAKMPSLTLGALLMRLRRLEVLQDRLNADQRLRLRNVVKRHDEVFREWNVHYKQKLVYEAKSRLKAMHQFFDECNDNPKSCASIYPPEVLRRTIVQEILIAMTEIDLQDDELTQLVRETDSRLQRAANAKHSFIWADELQPVYPEKPFWWLYRIPQPVE